MLVNWHDMFVLALPMVGEKILRPILVYLFLIVGLRLAGKRELAQLNPFDLIVLMTLSNTVQNAIIGDDNTLTGGLLGAATLLLINYMFVRFIHRHRRIEALMEGKRDFLIRNGRILKDHLNRELMTRAELLAAAHRQGIDSLAEIQTAVLEPTGTITFATKKPSADDTRHNEVLDMLEKLREELALLRSAKGPAGRA
jgi:uncharacterized membrane protein YcaP (DUF421 family)